MEFHQLFQEIIQLEEKIIIGGAGGGTTIIKE